MSPVPLPSHVLALTLTSGRGGGVEAYGQGVIEAIGELLFEPGTAEDC